MYARIDGVQVKLLPRTDTLTKLLAGRSRLSIFHAPGSDGRLPRPLALHRTHLVEDHADHARKMYRADAPAPQAT